MIIRNSIMVLALAAGLMAGEPPAAIRKAGEKPRIDLTAYTMTFNDEFDGTELDTSKWEAPSMPRQGGSRWMPNQVSVKDGLLRLGIHLTNDPILRYDCGAIRTQRNYDRNQSMFAQRYGYFEARCKLPRRINADYFADFWMMAGRVGEGNNTREGNEIDIFESFELAEGHPYSFNFHWGGYGKQHNVYGLKCGEQPQLRDGNFHVYGFLWTEQFYAVYVDGVEIGRTDMIGLGSDKDGKMLSNGPCREPGYLKLTVEAAQWPGRSPGWEPDAPAEDEFLIDWVRAYLPKTEAELASEKAAKSVPKAKPVLVEAAPQKPQAVASEEAVQRFRTRTFALVRASLAAGRHPQFRSTLMGVTVTVEACGEDGQLDIRTGINGSLISLQAKMIDPADYVSLAQSLAALERTPESRALAAFFLVAAGLRVEADVHLAYAGDLTAQVLASFTVPGTPVSTPNGTGLPAQ